jgi:hypothetical protein
MNRLFLILLLFMLTIITNAFGATTNCITKTGCPKDVKPPACCQPPPCEFYEQIRNKQALKNFFKDKKARALMKKQGKGDNPAAAKMLYDYVVTKAQNMGNNLKCSWTKVKFPPGFEVLDGSCDIVSVIPNPKDDANPIKELTSEKESQAKFDTCSEFISASFTHERLHKEKNSCSKRDVGLEQYADEEVEGYEKELEQLKADVLDYYRACTTSPDAALARRLAKENIEAKKKNQPPEKKDPRTQAKGN